MPLWPETFAGLIYSGPPSAEGSFAPISLKKAPGRNIRNRDRGFLADAAGIVREEGGLPASKAT
ncbi:hypothetical protein LCM4573_06315 [Rhizobium sp. LCM 4573]|nr:hypothetical protein LCM4573_06315 [Rhizobium sp. LCM 4573]